MPTAVTPSSTADAHDRGRRSCGTRAHPPAPGRCLPGTYRLASRVLRPGHRAPGPLVPPGPTTGPDWVTGAEPLSVSGRIAPSSAQYWRRRGRPRLACIGGSAEAELAAVPGHPRDRLSGTPQSRPRRPVSRFPRPRPQRPGRHQRHHHPAARRQALPHRDRPHPRRNPHPAAHPGPAHPRHQRRHRRAPARPDPRPGPQLPAHRQTPAPEKANTLTRRGFTVSSMS